MKAPLFALVASVVLASSAFAAQNQTLKLQDGIGLSVLRVKQYRNLMPVIVTQPGQPVPNRAITLVDFAGYACRTMNANDYKVVVEQRDGVQFVQVKEKELMYDCMGMARRQELTISTSDVLQGKPVVVVNPVEIEQLPERSLIALNFERFTERKGLAF